GVRDPRIPAAPPGPRRLARDARFRCLARERARDAARQRHRRDHRAAAPQDRRSLRAQAPAHRTRGRLRARDATGMRPLPLSVRARLTAWHALVLTLIVCVFSAGIVLFVKFRLYDELDRQLGRELAQIERVYREEPGELRDIASEWGM